MEALVGASYKEKALVYRCINVSGWPGLCGLGGGLPAGAAGGGVALGAGAGARYCQQAHRELHQIVHSHIILYQYIDKYTLLRTNI